MPRMRILSKTEQEQFETPPVFDSRQRKAFLEFPKYLLETAQTFRKTDNQIGFLLACGYFNSAKRFFAPKGYHQADIEAVANYLDVNSVGMETYSASTRQRHEHIILEFYGFRRFDNDAEVLLAKEIGTMVCKHPRPRLVFEHCLDILVQNRIQMPSSRTLADLVRTGLNHHKTELSGLVEGNLSDKMRNLLEELFTQSVTNRIDGIKPLNTRYRLTLLKKVSQSARPTKIKERISDFRLQETLYQELNPVIDILNLTDEGIRYYSGSVIKSQIFQLNQRSDEDRYLHAIAFITHQYYRLQDNLVDVLLGAVQTAQNSAKRDHKERVYNQRKAQENSTYQPDVKA